MNVLGYLIPCGDKRIFLAWLVLVLTSLAILWSVTEPLQGEYRELEPVVAKGVFYRQLFWAFLSYAGLLVAGRTPLRYLENIAVPLFLFSLVLLAMILVAGPKIGGAQRWLLIGPLRFQPSELAKVSTILLLASLLGKASEGEARLSVMIGSFLATLVPLVLVLREPDLGTSLVFLAIWVGMVFWYGIPGILLAGAGSAVVCGIVSFYSDSILHQSWPWTAYIVLLVVVLYFARLGIAAKITILLLNTLTGVGIPFFWGKLKAYQQERILTFFDPNRDAFGSGYQAIQSKVAIGSGGLFGTQYLKGTQKGLAFLPERHTDFVFSVIGEELGFVGAVFLLAVFLVILLQGIQIGTMARRPFARFLAIGVVSYFTFHVLVNVGITTGLLPVTGLPLPLLSYGGSNLLTSSIMLGLLLNVSSRTFDD
jgi:rod shape determining protein RodA|nr:rod shape-determining protein RodA [Candidatus Krumholzibacteria bacterium]